MWVWHIEFSSGILHKIWREALVALFEISFKTFSVNAYRPAYLLYWNSELVSHLLVQYSIQFVCTEYLLGKEYSYHKKSENTQNYEINCYINTTGNNVVENNNNDSLSEKSKSKNVYNEYTHMNKSIKAGIWI